MPIAAGVFVAFAWFYVFSLLMINSVLKERDDCSLNPFLESIAVLLDPKWLLCSVFGTVVCYFSGYWFFDWVITSV